MTPMLASPSGVNPDFEQQVTEDGATEDEPEGLEKNARRGESGDRAQGGALSEFQRPPEKVSLPSRAEDDAGVVEMGGGDGWVGDGFTGWVASAKPGSTARPPRRRRLRRRRSARKAAPRPAAPAPAPAFKTGGGVQNGPHPGSWYPGSPGKANGGANGVFMPKWKAQTPIEVFEDNDVSVDARSGAERLGNKHRYHVGDSSRRKSIDKAGFRDDTAIDSSGSKRAQGKTFPAFSGSVPVPSPLGLASAPGSPEKFFPGGAKEFGAALMRQSSADERDLARDLLGPPPPPSSPFAARREPSANHRPGNLSPPRSPTRARAFSHEMNDDVPSRPSSPAFGSSGAGAGAREETPTPCAPGARATPEDGRRRRRRAGAAGAAPLGPRERPVHAAALAEHGELRGRRGSI